MTDNTALAQELEGYIKAYDADYPALNEVYDVVCCVNENAEAILAALRTPAPAPVGGEPVAWILQVGEYRELSYKRPDDDPNWRPLYAHTQHPAPASDEVREMAERLRRLQTRHSIGGTALEEAADMLERLASQPLADSSTKGICK